MTTIILLLLTLFAFIAIFGLVRWRLWQFALLLLVLSLLFGWQGFGWLSAVTTISLLLTLPFMIKPIRQRWFSQKLLNWFRHVLPPLSETERTAIEAGTVWWDKDLFSGNPDWHKLLAFPAAKLTAEETAFLDGPTNILCGMLNDWQITHHDQDLPEVVWTFLREKKFFGMIVPKEYGGLGFSALANSAVVMKIASRSITAAVTVMVPNSLGPAELLLHYGTDDQREYYLPRLADGREIPCFALTSPHAGSDAGAIPDSGVVCYGEHAGQQVLGLRLNWNKRYITLGPVATVLGLAFKAYDPEHLLGEQEELGITCALIPTNTPGVNIGRRHFPLNIPFMNGPNSGENVFIPLDWVIGKQAGIGQGWRMLMGCLAAGRAISLPALATAGGKFSSRFVGAYAHVRRQFKLPIGKFEGVATVLARIAGLTYMMDAGRRLTASAIDQGEKPTVLSAILKYHNTEAMRVAINDGMDVVGGKGICLGPKNLLGRIYQAIPISITVEGANILTRNMMIFGQGAFRCHPYVLQEIAAAAETDADTALQQFDQAVWGHIGHVIHNACRSFLLSLTAGYASKAPVKGVMAAYYRDLSRCSAALALLTDISLLVLGGSLKRREALSARLGDCLSFLYYGSAILKRFADDGEPAEDEPLVHWAMQHCLYQIQQAMVSLLHNYPIAILGRVLRYALFPWGTAFLPPSDKLNYQVSQIILHTGAARERLTDGIFTDSSTDDITAQLEQALYLTILLNPVEKQIYKATGWRYLAEPDHDRLQALVGDGVLTAAEAQQLETLAKLTDQIIQVDDFANLK